MNKLSLLAVTAATSLLLAPAAFAQEVPATLADVAGAFDTAEVNAGIIAIGLAIMGVGAILFALRKMRRTVGV